MSKYRINTLSLAKIGFLLFISYLLNMACNGVAATETSPRIDSVTPRNGSIFEDNAVTISGSGFIVKVVRHISGRYTGNGEKLNFDDNFTLKMLLQEDGGQTHYLLDKVGYLDPQTLDGTVPKGIKPGMYDMEVTDPFGNKHMRRSAYEAYDYIGYVDPYDLPSDVDIVTDQELDGGTDDTDTDWEGDASVETETNIVGKSTTDDSGKCHSSQDCENPTPICSVDSHCRMCRVDDECENRDPLYGICRAGSCYEPYHCSGSIWATERIAPWDLVDVHVVDCDLACTGTLQLAAEDNGGEREFVLMQESPYCTGHFQGVLFTGSVFPCLSSNNEGCINVSNGSTITTFYKDMANEAAAVQTAQVTTEVISSGILNGDLSLSTLMVEDMSGADVNPGDTLRVCTQLTNNLFAAMAKDTTLVHRIPRGLSYVSGSIAGCLARDDHDQTVLRWDCGNIASLGSKTGCYLATVDPLPAFLETLPISIVGVISGSNARTQYPVVSFLAAR